MKAAILQSNYIPWKGYFDLMNSADVFVIYDEVQYTKNDWRNRNKIKTTQGLSWLTIPVRQERLSQSILETKVHNSDWRRKHWTAISMNYAKAPFFTQYAETFNKLYLQSDELYLSRINYDFITVINSILGINTRVVWSHDMQLVNGRTERLVHICQQLQASEYISGPAAKNYLDGRLFEQAGIRVSWMDYGGYAEYRQLYPPFVHAVSIIDLIFNEGPDAAFFLKSRIKTKGFTGD
jgi:hypothetical protein